MEQKPPLNLYFWQLPHDVDQSCMFSKVLKSQLKYHSNITLRHPQKSTNPNRKKQSYATLLGFTHITRWTFFHLLLSPNGPKSEVLVLPVVHSSCPISSLFPYSLNQRKHLDLASQAASPPACPSFFHECCFFMDSRGHACTGGAVLGSQVSGCAFFSIYKIC